MCVGSLSFQHYNPTKPSTTKPYKSLNVSFNFISLLMFFFKDILSFVYL